MVVCTSPRVEGFSGSSLCHSTKGPDPPKRVRRLERDGKMLNVNEGKYAG